VRLQEKSWELKKNDLRYCPIAGVMLSKWSEQCMNCKLKACEVKVFER